MRFLLILLFLVSPEVFADHSLTPKKNDSSWDQGLDRALEKLQKALEKRPEQSDQLLTSFWQELKTKVWSAEHRTAALELSKKLNLNLQFSDPDTSPLATKQIQEFAKELGPEWQGLEVLANGQPATEQDLESLQSHWVGLSTHSQPVIFWGRWSDFQKELKSKVAVAKVPELNQLLPEKTHLQEEKWPMKSPKVVSTTQKKWILLGLAGVLALSLKDKKLVIRH